MLNNQNRQLFRLISCLPCEIINSEIKMKSATFVSYSYHTHTIQNTFKILLRCCGHC